MAIIEAGLAEDVPMLVLNTVRVGKGVQDGQVPDMVVLLSMLVNAATIGWKAGKAKDLWRLHKEEAQLVAEIANGGS